jgi:hypothetical protein
MLEMKLLSHLILLFVSLQINTAFAQFSADDSQAWSWTRVEGSLDEQDLRILDKPIQYSMEVHYRLKNDMSDFHQLLLRPMLGYKLDETSTLWLGYAYIGQDRNGNYVNEHRLFQMITYSAKLGKSPVTFVGNTRLEQRQLENFDEINLRVRQMVRFSADLFKLKQGTFALFFQDEVFLRLNDTQWAGKSGFDHNRLTVGVDFKTKFGNAPATISVGYMYNTFPNQTTHGVNVGVRITIPQKKRKPRRR